MSLEVVLLSANTLCFLRKVKVETNKWLGQTSDLHLVVESELCISLFFDVFGYHHFLVSA